MAYSQKTRDKNKNRTEIGKNFFWNQGSLVALSYFRLFLS